ncbi:DegT/DnrJ/EryC1/StrS family aminotransferase [Sulfuricurvum sp. IAE1]|uniref:DegT/DnrJ/EryC1/StrS family aminotransferase n=1 Tax=Sulfuricurvum sp. IAE1 TaxID=2546102 RepID=UPI001044A893|nr:DegT/DnrJ/EryC1/StrS family aminotransferase [Sulfuricurvum sp. IAE1]TDA62655.1 DegT/DnrJ/EryC1/StrS family aminotransferase [Sulfuricurvum sp. IAE1]
MANSFRVPYVDLPSQYRRYGTELLETLQTIASSGQFILREEVSRFESEAARYLGVRYAVGVNSGTDALWLSLRAMGIAEGDEVITVSHTFVATIAAIVHVGAKPVLVDIAEDGNIDPEKIEGAITPRTKAIVVVHMNGKVCDMETIEPIALRHGLLILEDAAQAFGARYKERFAGSFGVCGAFSFHPMKVLGCMGDGGLVTTDDEAVYRQLLLLRNHGQLSKSELVLFGYNSRLDNLQAAVLIKKLPYLEEELLERERVARYYQNGLGGIPHVRLPAFHENGRRDVFSSYVIRAENRDGLFDYLMENGVEVAIHWKIPNHRQAQLGLDGFGLETTERYSAEILSLPIHPYLDESQTRYVVDKVIEFYA